MDYGRTCEYRTYLSSSTSYSSSTYNVTVEIDHVYYRTYLGVYQYHTDSKAYELVREVAQLFTGNITTTMDDNTEVYVLMHPFVMFSYAEFTIHVDRISGSSSNAGTDESNGGGKKLSAVEVLLIVLSIIIFLILLVGFVLLAY